MAALPNAGPSTEHHAELCATSLDQGNPSVSAELPLPNDSGHFLSIIFEREELRLPATHQWNQESITNYLVIPVALSTAPQGSSLMLLPGSGSLDTYPKNESAPSSGAVPSSRDIPDETEVNQHSYSQWTSFPTVCDGLATSPSFIVAQDNTHLHRAFEAPIHMSQLSPWAIMCVNAKSGPVPWTWHLQLSTIRAQP